MGETLATTEATTLSETSAGPTGSSETTNATDPTIGESESEGTTCQAFNACGGCEPLMGEPGQPCGGCDETVWACDGMDKVFCQGEDPDAQDYWPDNDSDGYGDEDASPSSFCEPPGNGWSQNSDDCEDDEPSANPKGIEVCNGIDDDCNGQTDEGPEGANCDDVCCDIQQACDGTQCVDKCPNGDICGENLDVCCEGSEVCYANACVVPGDECEFTEECALDEVCAPGLDQCVPEDAIPDCEFIPEFDAIEPTQGCKWKSAGQVNASHKDVVATPIVINLTDDNNDGLTNDDDIPEIAFLTYNVGVSCCNTPATLRIVSGECNDDQTMNTLASISSPVLTNDSGLAAGDLDGDGIPEIVATMRTSQPQGTVAFRRVSDDGTEWEIMWQNNTYPTWNVHTRGGPVISLADLEGDGDPEVIVGNVVLDGQSGMLKWDGNQTTNGQGGIGNNGFLGPSSTVADLDLDGIQEVVAGNTVYAADGSEIWSFNYRRRICA